MNSDKEAIRVVNLVQDVIGQTVELRPAGRRLVGLCPFHDDHNPSLHVDPQHQVWHCSPCAIHGADVFEWVMRRDRVDFAAALRTLADGVGLTNRRAKRSTARSATWRLSDADAMDKLRRERLVDDSTIQHFLIEPDGERQAWRYPVHGGSRYKAYRGDAPREYWSTPGLANQLYGIADVLEPTDWVFWVNGEPAVWQCWQAGLPAVCGFGEGQVPADARNLLQAKGVKRTVIVPDRGATGAELGRRTAHKLAATDFDVLIAELPKPVGGDGADLGDLFVAVSGNGELFRTAVTELREAAQVYVAPQGTVSTAASDDLPSPISLNSQWPEQLKTEAFHGLAGDLVRTIEPHTEADSGAMLLQFLTSFGNVVGRGPHFRVEADTHTMNLFVVLVGETGKGRKGVSFNHAKQLLEVLDPAWAELVTTGLSSGEGLIWAVRDPIIKMEPIKNRGIVDGYQEVEVDPGVSDKRLLVYEPEFASTLRVMGRDGNTLSPIIRAAWDRGDLRTLTKNSPARATGAHISIIGHITADEFRRYLDRTEMANGFANRLLPVCVKRSKVLPEGGQLRQVDFNPLTRRLLAAVAFAKGAGEIRFGDDARAIWHQVYPELSEGKLGLVGAVTGRAEAQALRLACLFALLDESNVIHESHLRAALEVWRYCEASARYVFGDSMGDPVADEILGALHNSYPGGLTRTELHGVFAGHSRGHAIERALGRLMGLGLVRREIDTETGGRPAERWFAVTPDAK